MREQNAFMDIQDRRYNSFLERAFYNITLPFEELIKHKATRGIVLLISAVLGLAAVNSPLSDLYLSLIHTPISLQIGSWELEESLQLWVNDGLMGIFFLAVGLEIKKEMLVGALSTPRKAALPFIAALGGMVVPAAIFHAFNPAGLDARGWGIPMATDIAFVIGVLALLGDRAPRSLYVFLVTLAIADDLGAILVIALFYTRELHFGYLNQAGIMFALLVLFNLVGIKKPLPYLLVGAVLWFSMLKSGVHATIAGVLVAAAIPARPKTNPAFLVQTARDLLTVYETKFPHGKTIRADDEHHAVIRLMKQGTDQLETPLHRLLDDLLMPVAFIVLPIFAFVNAGIPMEFEQLRHSLTHPVAWGVIAGLLAGKCVGISSSSWLAVKLNLGSLPEGLTARHIFGGSLLAGMGFTMSMFISVLGYRESPDLQTVAKTGIIYASLTAGFIGYTVLRLTSRLKQTS
jgi:NhaA family Na+:H+ antiporter